MKIPVLSLLLLIISFYSCQRKSSQIINLNGEWKYRIDKERSWVKRKLGLRAEFNETIMLPAGPLRDYGIGNEPNLQTNWTGSIYDSSWYFNPAMEKYRQPRQC